VADRISFRNPIIPCFYLHQIIRHCFSEYGYTLKYDWLLDDNYFKKIALFNTWNIVREKRYHLHGLRVSGLWMFDRPMHHIDSSYEQGKAIWGLFQEDTEINPSNHLEAISIKDFLQDFALSFGCRFRISADKRVTIEHLELDKTASVIETWGPKAKIVNPRLKGFALKYKLSVDSSLEHIEDFEQKVSDIRETASTVTAPFSPPLSGAEIGLDQNINILFDKNGEAVENLIPYTYKNGEKVYEILIPPAISDDIWYHQYNWADATRHQYDITTDVGDLSWLPFFDQQVIEYGGDDVYWLIYGLLYNPDTGQDTIIDLERDGAPGTSDPQTGDTINLKTIYHGLVGTTGYIPIDYPYASNHNWKPGFGGVELGWFHLGLLGEKGIIKTFHGQMLPVWTAEEYHVLKHRH
jgi:hypothetical protein